MPAFAKMWSVSTREDETPTPNASFGRLGSPPPSSEASPRFGFLGSPSYTDPPSSYGSPRVHDASPHETPRASNGVDERMRAGLVVAVVPQGGRGLISDWIFYMQNNHVLLSAIFAHPSHPYPLQRRRLVLLNSLCFCFFITSLLFLAGYALPSVPAAWRSTLGMISLLRDWPTTASVVLQLVWDVPGSSLGICPCARSGMPPALRKPCGYGMLCCLACHLLGVIYWAVGAALLLLFGPGMSLQAARKFSVLFWWTKLLALLLAVPTGTVIFLLLRRHELTTGPAPFADSNGSSRSLNGDAIMLDTRGRQVSTVGAPGASDWRADRSSLDLLELGNTAGGRDRSSFHAGSMSSRGASELV